jgi:hypothetical protein
MHLNQTNSLFALVMSQLLRSRTLRKVCHLLSALSIADKDGPVMKYSMKVALNVQAAITWYTRMCKVVEREGQPWNGFSKKKSHLYFKLLYSIILMVVFYTPL